MHAVAKVVSGSADRSTPSPTHLVEDEVLKLSDLLLELGHYVRVEVLRKVVHGHKARGQASAAN